MAKGDVFFQISTFVKPVNEGGSVKPDPKLFPEIAPVNANMETGGNTISESLIKYDQMKGNNKYLFAVFEGPKIYEEVDILSTSGPHGYSIAEEHTPDEFDSPHTSQAFKDFLLSPEYDEIVQAAKQYMDYDELFSQKAFFIESVDTPNGERYVSVQANEDEQSIDCTFYDKDLAPLSKEQIPIDIKNLDAETFRDALFGRLKEEKNAFIVEPVGIGLFNDLVYQKDAISKLGVDDKFVEALNDSGWEINFSDSGRPNEYAADIQMLGSKYNLMCFSDSYENLLENVQTKAETIAAGDFPNSINPEKTRAKFSDLGKLAGNCLKKEQSLSTKVKKLTEQVPPVHSNAKSAEQSIG